MDVQNAVKTLAQALKEDEGFFYAYQSNIAMAFYDEVKRHDLCITHEKLHEISNNGAKAFLQLFVGEAMKPVETPAEEKTAVPDATEDKPADTAKKLTTKKK